MTSPTVRIKSIVSNPIGKSDGSAQPYIGLEDIASNTGKLLVETLSTKSATDSICHSVGDVLFSKLRPYLAKSYIPEVDGTGTGELLVLRPGSKVDRRFLLYITLSTSWLNWANSTAYGTKMPRTSWELLAEYRLWLPPLEEQRRIADFLDAETSRMDQIAALRRKMRENLTVKRAAMVEAVLFCDAGTGSDVPMVPLKYVVTDIEVGIVVTPARWYVEGDGVAALRGTNVKPGRIDTSELVQLSREGDLQNRKSSLRAGDVVVVRTGQAGAAAVVPDSLDGANCIDLIIVRPGKSVSPHYLEYVLNSGRTGDHISEHSVGSIQAHFNVGSMKQVLIPLRSISQQLKIVARLNTLTRLIDTLLDRIARQEQLLAERRQALITAAITGQLDITTASGRNLTQGV